ncbi:MAG: PCMD domain-containing protein [[Clostridium] fimetarium]|nr:PCMD domain-containing protein [Alistipes timonensis]MCM1406567.1 PCMD domain-containing protein [[Clostridium] fimetarium]
MSDKKRKQKESLAMARRQRWVMIAAALMAAAFLAVMSQSCIKNDIPYPRIQANFSSFEAEGLKSPAQIDSANRIIDLVFEETVDMEQVKVTSYTLSPKGVELLGTDLSEPVNLTRYLILRLRMYQEYDWVIRGSQPIERYLTVEGQIGETVIDVAGKRAVVTVSETMGRKAVKVLTAKLGPEGSTMTPDPAGNTYDLSMPLEITVNVHGREEKWELFCEIATFNVYTLRADAGSQVAWVFGSGLAGTKGGFEYRVAGTAQWRKAPDSWITQTGNTFSATLRNLEPETEYEARALTSDNGGEPEYATPVKFTTGETRQLPNSSFDEWTWINNSYWAPWGEGQTPYWDTGNKGAATFGPGNVVRSDQTSTGTGYSAELQTVYKTIKLAAGSIFAGTYVRTDITDGVLSFGRPYDLRPTKLRGYFKYNCAVINQAKGDFAYMKGQPDTCTVWCALIDSPDPFEIRTKPSDRHLFDPEGSYVIAYGKMECAQTVPQFIPFEFELDYRSTQRVPKYILVVGSASKYGDYFVGGEGSTLWLDDFELLYDY